MNTFRGINVEIDFDSICNYEQMKSKLFVEVISADRNAEILQSIPHEIIEDLAIVYYIKTGCEVLVTNQMLNHYGVTKEQLHADALENAPKIKPVRVKGLIEMLVDEYGEKILPLLEMTKIPAEEMVYVATVPDHFKGAGVIVYPNFLQDMTKKLGGDFYVLPSSIHEVLLVKGNMMQAPNLRELVKLVNATSLEAKDQLTDNVYCFSKEIFRIA